MTPRRKRLFVVLGILGGVAASVSLAVMASRENIMFYYDPSQVVEGKAPVAKRFRIGGMVVKGSVARHPGDLFELGQRRRPDVARRVHRHAVDDGHEVAPLQLRPSWDTQALTVRPSLIASARANCKSPSSPLISPAMRLELVTYRNDGMASAMTIAATAMVISNSSSVKPVALGFMTQRLAA